MLLFAPEDFPTLQSRLTAALLPVYDVDAIERGEVPAPATQRAHVFDFRDGLRLIVSTDQEETRGVYTHLSASYWPGTPLERQVLTAMRRSVSRAMKDFRLLVETRWRRLHGPPVAFTLWSAEKHIPHWFGPAQEVARGD